MNLCRSYKNAHWFLFSSCFCQGCWSFYFPPDVPLNLDCQQCWPASNSAVLHPCCIHAVNSPTRIETDLQWRLQSRLQKISVSISFGSLQFFHIQDGSCQTSYLMISFAFFPPYVLHVFCFIALKTNSLMNLLENLSVERPQMLLLEPHSPASTSCTWHCGFQPVLNMDRWSITDGHFI